MTLTFQTEADFLAAFPNAQWYVKANNPTSPCFGIRINGTANVSKAGWVDSWADITNHMNGDAHLVLVNTAIGECYACAIAPNNHPVGYKVAQHQPAGYVTAYRTRDEKSPLLVFSVISEVFVQDKPVTSDDVIFARLQDGTLGVCNPDVLRDMAEDTSGLFQDARVVAYVSEPVLASDPLTEEYLYEGLEGVKRAPVGSRLLFSDSKNLYFNTEAKWIQMGLHRV